MNISDESAVSLRCLAACGLVQPHEVDAVENLAQDASPFRPQVDLAETLHLHIKVDDTHALPINQFFQAGAVLDHSKDGFVKYLFPGGINAIFSHIKVSQDELMETESTRRPRPFLDHIGIDMRAETEPVRSEFNRLPDQAESLNWSLSSQGGPDRPVYCCHVEVAEKHWLYPPDEAGHPGIPLEFAYGELKVNPSAMGCDLRPADPAKVDPSMIPSCCGSPSDAGTAPRSAYYDPSDLGRFADITRVNPKIGQAFFGYYSQVMEESVLTGREKALIALAIAHALRCPYCIDAYTTSLQQMGCGEDEMSEAVHVAAAMAAGITLVHSVQMMKKLDSSAEMH